MEGVALFCEVQREALGDVCAPWGRKRSPPWSPHPSCAPCSAASAPHGRRQVCVRFWPAGGWPPVRPQGGDGTDGRTVGKAGVDV